MNSFEVPSENIKTVFTIEMVAQHGYMAIAELFDERRFDEAGKVADVLSKCGII